MPELFSQKWREFKLLKEHTASQPRTRLGGMAHGGCQAVICDPVLKGRGC